MPEEATKEGARRGVRLLIVGLIFLAIFTLTWLGGFDEQVTAEVFGPW